MEEYKKSYKGFIVWIVLFFVVNVGVCFLPLEAGSMLRIIDNICTLGVALLTYIIYKTEQIYWYSGISFAEARDAGSEKRKIFAWKHLKRFGLFAIIFLIYSVIVQSLAVSYWSDVVIAVVGMIGVAVSTINIKL